MYRVAEHTSLFIRGVLGGENKSYQHVVMAAQAFDFAVQHTLTRAFSIDWSGADSCVAQRNGRGDEWK